ncbi:PREDICTED: uncharacterized protein KIAA1671 homolog [Dipodomys ordii]|uniref:Uncharacterized protein KIAA1671 homolog n=1 Tax=Dipodomys ordii TaxID=10020 RepID=A0A1S3EZ88_DIPOR|nr:PREDICTED: uncharacterized protein KIAA1671 homolog [Dipodomys ordii]
MAVASTSLFFLFFLVGVNSRLSACGVLGAHGSAAVAMVEVGSLLTAVPGLHDFAKDEALKRTYFYPAGDPARTPSACILRTPARCFPLPRLTPKPFSKEQGLRWGAPGPSRPGPAGVPQAASQGPDGRMPSLAGQEVGGGEAARAGSASPHKASDLRLDTHIAGPPVGTGTGEPCLGTRASVPCNPPCSSRPQLATKPALPTHKPPGNLPRPASLSLDARLADPQHEEEGHAPGPRLRPRRRPVSAVFTESLLLPGPGPGGAALGGKPPPAPPEKTWVRKPRPLSVDLTGRFESREVLLRRGAGPERRATEGASPEPTVDRPGTVPAASSRLDLDADFWEVARKIQDRKEKMLLKQAEADSPRTRGGHARAISGGDQSPQEEKDRPDPEPEKVPESPPVWLGRSPGPAEAKSKSADREASVGAEWVPMRSVKKRLSLFGEERALAPAAGSEATVATPEVPLAAPKLAKAGVSVQERIKGWAAESAEEKVEIRKRALQARPRSADLTKVFSSSAPSSEIRYEKCAALGGERREKQKMENIPTPRSPWKPGDPQKASRQTECHAGSSRDPDSPGQASRVSPEGEGSFQTVWATVFEHHVERHSVAEQGAHLPACLSSPRSRPEGGSWLRKDPPAGQAALSDCVPGPCPAPAPEKPTVGDSRGQAPLPKHPASLPWVQRVEPRLDIVHAIGDKAHSEAVATAVGDKALTLRSSRPRRSLQGRRLTQEVSPAAPEDGPEAPVGAVHRASLIWEARGQESIGPKLDFQEPGAAPGSSCSAPRWTGGAGAPWHSTAVARAQEPCSRRDISTKVAQATPWEAQRQGPDGVGHKPGADRAPAQGGTPEPLAWSKDQACEPQARRHPETKEPLPAASEGDPPPAWGPEPGVKLRKPHPGDPKMDRWRRRTLPHDTKFDVFHFLPPENSHKAEQRRTGPLSPPAGAPQKPPEPRGVTAGPSWSPASPGPLGSPGEPPATFFAVTYQIPDTQKAKSMVKLGLENLPEHSRKTALAASPLAFPSAVVSPSQEQPSGPPGSKPRAQGNGGDHATTAPKAKKATERPWSVGDGVRDWAGDRPLAMGALWIPPGLQDGSAPPNPKKDSWHQGTPSTPSGPQASPDPRSQWQAGGQPGRRKTNVISDTFPGKVKDAYRPSVLDLDALMAEYKAKTASAAGQPRAPPPSPTEEAGAWPPERPARPGGVAPEARGAWKRASVAQMADSPTFGPNKPQMGDPGPPKFTSPLWGPPLSVPAQAASSPPRKVSALTQEGQGAVATMSQSQPAGAKPPGGEDAASGTRVAPKSPPAITPRTPSRRGQGDGLAPWSGPPSEPRRPLDVKGACSEKGPPARVQEAAQRWPEQPRGRPGLPPERPEAQAGPCRREPPTPDSQPVSPWDVGRGGGPRGSEQPLRTLSPGAAGPRRSQSLCQDQRAVLCVDQLKQCFSRRSPEAKDTDTLVQAGGGQDSVWAEPRARGDSSCVLVTSAHSSDAFRGGAGSRPHRPWRLGEEGCVPAPRSVWVPCSGDEEPEGCRGLSEEGKEGKTQPGVHTALSPGPVACAPRLAPPSPHTPQQTSVLDSSALKTRVQLSKRSRRRAPTLGHALRSRSGEAGVPTPVEEEADSLWMFKDSTEEKSPRREESDEEENPASAERTPAGPLHRTPAFPGLDPAALKARLHGPSETPGWAPRTPKSPFQPGVLGGRVLPSSVDKDERSEEPSPQWLRELKSKKRQSLCENQA